MCSRRTDACRLVEPRRAPAAVAVAPQGALPGSSVDGNRRRLVRAGDLADRERPRLPERALPGVLAEAGDRGRQRAADIARGGRGCCARRLSRLGRERRAHGRDREPRDRSQPGLRRPDGASAASSVHGRGSRRPAAGRVSAVGLAARPARQPARRRDRPPRQRRRCGVADPVVRDGGRHLVAGRRQAEAQPPGQSEGQLEARHLEPAQRARLLVLCVRPDLGG